MRLPIQASTPLLDKLTILDDLLADHERVAIAYSGGTDSNFLTWYVKEVLHKQLVAVLVTTTFLAARELENARKMAAVLDLDLEEITVDPLANPQIRANPTRRCYFCKQEIMQCVKERARQRNCSAVLDGTQGDDRKAHRPGRQALEELGIQSPLAAAGLTKQEIRELSRQAGLATWNRPSQSCLATRIPYDTPISEARLAAIDRAEELLQDLGCQPVRVRVHGQLARIEVDTQCMPVLLRQEVRERVLQRFRELGFHHTTMDLAGFRSGSWDEQIENHDKTKS